MKGIFLLVHNYVLGKKILYFDAEVEWADQTEILRNFKNKVNLLSGSSTAANEIPFKYGMTKEFFRELFLPSKTAF